MWQIFADFRTIERFPRLFVFISKMVRRTVMKFALISIISRKMADKREKERKEKERKEKAKLKKAEDDSSILHLQPVNLSKLHERRSMSRIERGQPSTSLTDTPSPSVTMSTTASSSVTASTISSTKTLTDHNLGAVPKKKPKTTKSKTPIRKEPLNLPPSPEMSPIKNNNNKEHDVDTSAIIEITEGNMRKQVDAMMDILDTANRWMYYWKKVSTTNKHYIIFRRKVRLIRNTIIRVHDDHSFLFRTREDCENQSRNRRNYFTDVMKLSLTELNDVLDDLGLLPSGTDQENRIITRISDLASAMKILEHVTENDKSEEMMELYKDTRIKYIKYRKLIANNESLKGNIAIEEIDAVVRGLVDYLDNIELDFDSTMEDVNLNSLSLVNIPDSSSPSVLHRELDTRFTRMAEEEHADDPEEVEAQTYEMLLETSIMIRNESEIVEVGSPEIHEEAIKLAIGQNDDDFRDDDSWLIKKDPNHEENTTDIDIPHPIYPELPLIVENMKYKKYKNGDKALLLIECPCGKIYGNFQRANTHAASCTIFKSKKSTNANSDVDELLLEEDVTFDEDKRNSPKRTPKTNKPKTTIQKNGKKYNVAEPNENLANRPHPRSSTFKGSYDESKSDSETETEFAEPSTKNKTQEVFDVSSGEESNNDVEILFENQGPDSGLEDEEEEDKNVDENVDKNADRADTDNGSDPRNNDEQGEVEKMRRLWKGIGLNPDNTPTHLGLLGEITSVNRSMPNFGQK